MAGELSATIDTVKFVGRPFWSYVKNQYHFSANLNDFNSHKQDLLQLHGRIRSRLDTELHTGRKIARNDVETWLAAAAVEISRQSIEDEVSQSGCLSSCICRTRILKRRTAELNRIYDQGERLSLMPSLVDDDYPRIVLDDIQIYKERKEKLLCKLQDVEWRLRTQLQDQAGKTETGEVKLWRRNVEEKTGTAAASFENQFNSVLHGGDFSKLVKEKNQQLEELLHEGALLSASLVVDDYSQTLRDDEMQSFEEWKEKLQGKRRDIEFKLSSELRQDQILTENVNLWLQKVEDISILGESDVQNQLNSRRPPYPASLVIRVKELIQKMEELCNEGDQLPTDLVMNDPSISALELPTSELEGRDATKAEIFAYLMGDEVTKLGVHGMGGIGKTTIMEHVYNQLLKKSKFEKVIWVTVSQTFDVRQIQQQIASSLNESLPEHQNTVVRAATLLGMLGRHKPYVMILDDVWSSFELKDVGIPEPCVNDCCKLALTTRSWAVVREMRCDPIEVKILSQEASLNLFKDVVGDVSLLEDEAIKEILKPIVDECNGLPLAIKVVASSMRGIFEPRLWRDALRQLRLGRRDDVFSTLKFSYDGLNDKKIQWCLLHCALYPEDYKIPKEALVEYWMDEELIEVMETRQAMKDEGYAILKKLEENCLLELTMDKSARYGKHNCVRMHDLVRDMALSITKSSSPRFLVKAGVGLRELPEENEWKEDLLKVSFMSRKMEEIPSSMPSPRCPMLTTLLLSRNNFSSIPELFFEHMPELEVLDLSNNWRLSSLPSSISKLVKLTTLLLQGCRSLKEVPSLSNLTDLKKLNLNWTAIEEAPDGLEKLIKLKYLGLYVGHISDEAIPKWEISLSEILPYLSKLQYLRIYRRISVKSEVVGSLCKLEEFCGRFHSASDMITFFISRRVSLHRYNISAGRYTRHVHVGKMKHIYCSGIDMRGEPNMLPSDVQSLRIERCNDVRSLNDVVGFQDITDLQECLIRECEGIEYVFSWSNQHTAVRKKSAPPVGMFSSLKITKLLPTSALLHLQNLKEIEVTGCKQLEEIFAGSSSSSLEEDGGGESLKLTLLPKLKKLRLVRLPKLKSICGSTSRLICDSLEYLRIEHCKELKRIPLHLPQSDDGQVSPPPHLKTIYVSTREWWESLEWDQPNAKDVLLPFCSFHGEEEEEEESGV